MNRVTDHIKAWLTMATLAALMSACAARPPTVPTAIVYDRDQDTWRVEVEPVEGEPEYRQTLPIFTESAEGRREGLIPPAKHRMLTRHGGMLSWGGPVAVRHHRSFWRDNPWRVQLFNMKGPIVENPDEPAEVKVWLDEEFADPWPRYRVWLKGAGAAR